MSDGGLSVCVGASLRRHTALRTGGPCGAWVVAHDVDALATVATDCRQAGWPWRVVGATTRTVVRDGPLPGAVVRLGVGFSHIERDDEVWTVGAAVPVPALVAAAAAAGRTGLEPLACVAGSVGGSVLHDDGWDEIVDDVDVFLRGRAAPEDLSEARRRKRTVLAVRLRLAADDPAAVRARSDATWQGGQPVPPGSWYGPPRRIGVRRMLRSARLTVVRLREVAIPSRAPELLVNLGRGTAADLSLLHRSVLDRVQQVRGEGLTSTVRFVGTADPETT